MHYIYAVVNKENSNVYIGQAAFPRQRWYQHKTLLRKQEHSNSHLQRAWQKYGEGNFEHFVLDEFPTRAECDEAEKLYIAWYKQLGIAYNICDGGEGTCGLPRTPEHQAKIVESGRKTWTPERREHLASLKRGNKYFEGKSHSEETKQVMSESRKGELNPHYGKATSVKQKQAASATWKGKQRGPFTEEHKQKIREARQKQVMRPMSEETKDKIRQKKLMRDKFNL